MVSSDNFTFKDLISASYVLDVVAAVSSFALSVIFSLSFAAVVDSNVKFSFFISFEISISRLSFSCKSLFSC